jgi:hypothetical protein
LLRPAFRIPTLPPARFFRSLLLVRAAFNADCRRDRRPRPLATDRACLAKLDRDADECPSLRKAPDTARDRFLEVFLPRP